MKNRIVLLLTGTIRKYRINHKYKDHIFRLVFRNRKHMLALYNAINGTDYTNPEDLDVRTLEDAIYLGYKNDLSFLISNTLNLYEHQSSLNPNMPLRGLIYFAAMFKAYIAEKKYNIYGSTQVPLPTPRYIVFYNGRKDLPDKMVLRLSDAFEENASEAALECKATMLNINLGHNVKLMEECPRLEEYAYFVAAIRRYQEQGVSMEDAVEDAIKECIEKDKITDILVKNRAEVKNMLLTDYDEREYRKLVKKTAWEEGLTEGRSKGLEEGRSKGLEEGRSKGLEESRKLNKYLLRDNRFDDLKRSLDDRTFQLELMKEYRIR